MLRRSVEPSCHKRAFAVQNGMSALPPKADMCSALVDVRSVPIANSCSAAKTLLFDYLVGQRHRPVGSDLMLRTSLCDLLGIEVPITPTRYARSVILGGIPICWPSLKSQERLPELQRQKAKNSLQATLPICRDRTSPIPTPQIRQGSAPS